MAGQSGVATVLIFAINAFGLLQQVIVRLAVRMGLQKRRLAGRLDYPDFAFLARGLINCVETGLSFVDQVNGFFPSEAPLLSQISNVGDMFMGTVVVRLIDARDVVFLHSNSFFLFVMASARRLVPISQKSISSLNRMSTSLFANFLAKRN